MTPLHPVRETRPGRPPIAPESLTLSAIVYGLAACPAIAAILHCIFTH